jgi:hypothetical protein
MSRERGEETSYGRDQPKPEESWNDIFRKGSNDFVKGVMGKGPDLIVGFAYAALGAAV